METTHSFDFEDLPGLLTVSMPDEREEIKEIIALIGDKHFPKRRRKRTQLETEYLSPIQLAQKLGKSKEFGRRLCLQLPHKRIGRTILIREKTFDAYMAGETIPQTGKRNSPRTIMPKSTRFELP